MAGVKASPSTQTADLEQNGPELTDFALRLFKASHEDGENTLISPLSALLALAMCANGAKGKTLSQMETVFGLDVRTLNPYMHDYLKLLTGGKKSLHLANSIWLTNEDTFLVQPDFLQTNADYYSADAYQAPFDNSTQKEINESISAEIDVPSGEMIRGK